MARPSSFVNMQEEKKAKLQEQFVQKRKQLTVSKDNKYKKAMLESVLKEYARHLFINLKNNSKEKIMEQVSIVINKAIDTYPRMLSTADWNDVYKKVNELNFWNQELVRDKIKFNFLKNKAVMSSDDGLATIADSNTMPAADIKENDELAEVDTNGDAGTESYKRKNEVIPPTDVKDPVSKTIEDLNEKVNDSAGVESLNTFINKTLNDNTRMYVEGYYNLIVSAMKSINSVDPWFMTL